MCSGSAYFVASNVDLICKLLKSKMSSILFVESVVMCFTVMIIYCKTVLEKMTRAYISGVHKFDIKLQTHNSGSVKRNYLGYKINSLLPVAR